MTMTEFEKLRHLQTWINEMNAADASIQPVIDVLRLTGEDPVCDTIWRLQTALTNAYKLALGDELDTLNWFAYENDLGRKGMEAGPTGALRPIRTAHDLLWLMEA